ncbi:DUF4253 domain-containing protein [Catellatospora sp. TT07R-123]|uniref:DUF4253 domain-containing protein n=1 Tax=Catellatospora sp. TT07R-123 TaxID=2733863 RepID=UPI001BB3A3D3|nr:DUF4253 domain-containing protein [Catellatospora sp. TT07R-123]
MQRLLDTWGVFLPGLCSAPVGDLHLFGAPAPRDWHTVWEQLRDVHGETGLWPFVSPLRPAEFALHAGERAVASPLAPAQMIAQLRAATREDWLREAKWGNWSAVVPRLEPAPFTGSKFLESELNPTAWLLLLPAAAGGTDLPLPLRAPYANNWCGDASHPWLTSADHAAVWTSWRDRFGAEVLHLDHSSVEFVVHRPPITPAEISEVTEEQWAYCPDLGQVFGDPEWVARKQVPARRWYFWWD